MENEFALCLLCKNVGVERILLLLLLLLLSFWEGFKKFYLRVVVLFVVVGFFVGGLFWFGGFCWLSFWIFGGLGALLFFFFVWFACLEVKI